MGYFSVGIIIAVNALFFVSCSQNIFDERLTRKEPFPGVITARNLNNGKSAYLTWQEDAGADAYRIMRAINDENPVVFAERENNTDGFSLHGTTAAMDSTLEDDKGYFYRLDKKRDSVWITGKEITAFSRTRMMPVADTPIVRCFRPDGKILISWQYDEGADEYILMRAQDNSLALDPFTAIYRGMELKYLDATVKDDMRYIYKLYKIRNGIEYRWDDRIGLGVSVRTQEDQHEPNNTEAEATLLETYLLANIYCYGFSTGHVLEDIDWYKVSIPPGKVANMAVSYDDTVYDTYLLLYIPYFDTRTIIHNTAFQVKNDSRVQKDVAFAIIADKTQFLPINSTGGKVVGYTITWQSIENN
jgi:hypothetical protein